MLVTRLAPTPSGYLHPGNLVNLVLTSWLARASAGRLLLRIDDFDVPRMRPEYLDDVFRTLDWLGIEIDQGPSGPADFLAHWSMSTRIDQFRSARDALLDRDDGSVFACRCSRSELDAGGRCVSGCAAAQLDLVPGVTALRMRHPGTGSLPPGDHVLWRRDDLPAYQLGSVVVDEELAITHIVRGADLRESTAVQVHLAGLLQARNMLSARVLHHPLLVGAAGEKLSKSAGSGARPLQHTPGLRDSVLRRARGMGAPLGIVPP